MNNIKKLKDEFKVEQKEIARVTGLNKATLSLAVNKDRDLRQSTIDKLAEYFSCSSDYLLGKPNGLLEIRLYLSPNTNYQIINITEDELRQIPSKDYRAVITPNGVYRAVYGESAKKMFNKINSVGEKAKIENIRAAEIRVLVYKLNTLDDEDFKTVETIVDGILNKDKYSII